MIKIIFAVVGSLAAPFIFAAPSSSGLYEMNVGETKVSDAKALYPSMKCEDVIDPGAGGLRCNFNRNGGGLLDTVSITFDANGVLQYTLVTYNLENRSDFAVARFNFVKYFGDKSTDIRGIDRVQKINNAVVKYQSSFNPNFASFEIYSQTYYDKSHAKGYGRSPSN